jgi:hypothetical protein
MMTWRMRIIRFLLGQLGGIFYDDEDEEIDDEPIRQEEDEEEEGAEGVANPQQGGRVPFPRKPTIRKPYKPLSYNANCYQSKGTTEEVKRLHKIDPTPQLKRALDYRVSHSLLARPV